MIDQSTTISWAKDAGFDVEKPSIMHYKDLIYAIQNLITRAQNEAYMEAASRSECRRYMSENFADFAEELRELIQAPPKPTQSGDINQPGGGA
jgi:hypothetical protein